MNKRNYDELLRMVSFPTRLKNLDDLFNYEVTAVVDVNSEVLLVNISDYEQRGKSGVVYRLKDEFPNNKYRNG